MKALVDWVLAQRLRSIVIAVVAAPLMPVISSALIALETVRRGGRWGSICAAFVILGIASLAAMSGTDIRLFAAMGVICALSGVAVGALIERARNLALAFQAALLTSWVTVAFIGVLGIDGRMLFGPVIDELGTLLRSEMSAEQAAVIEQRGVAALLAMAVFSQLMGSLLLAYWWALLAAGQKRFGIEFRELRLGRILGVIATALVLLGLVFDWELVQNLTPLALLGFLLQGLSVLHAWAHAKKWNAGLLAPFYVLLLLPGLNVLAVVPLGIVGLVDQWFDLRAPLRSQS